MAKEELANKVPTGELDEGLSEDDHRRFTALVAWSFSDEWYGVDPLFEQDSARLVISGEADARAIPELEEALAQIVEACPKSLVVDLSEAIFVSVGVMLCVVDAARHLDRVVVYRPNNAMRRVFSLVDPEHRCEVVG